MVSRARVLREVARRYGEERAAVVADRVPAEVDPIADADTLRELGLEPCDVVGVHVGVSHCCGANPIEVATWLHDDDTPDHYGPPRRKISHEPIVGSGGWLDPANKHYRVEADMYPL